MNEKNIGACLEWGDSHTTNWMFIETDDKDSKLCGFKGPAKIGDDFIVDYVPSKYIFNKATVLEGTAALNRVADLVAAYKAQKPSLWGNESMMKFLLKHVLKNQEFINKAMEVYESIKNDSTQAATTSSTQSAATGQPANITPAEADRLRTYLNALDTKLNNILLNINSIKQRLG